MTNAIRGISSVKLGHISSNPNPYESEFGVHQKASDGLDDSNGYGPKGENPVRDIY